MERDLTDNELIAEFLEWKPDKVHGQKGAWKPTAATPEFIGLYSLRLFEESWDWLIPVVEKTHIICDQMMRKYPEHKDLDDATGWRAWSYRHPKLTTDITRVYNQVVEFIKFYNQNRKQ